MLKRPAYLLKTKNKGGFDPLPQGLITFNKKKDNSLSLSLPFNCQTHSHNPMQESQPMSSESRYSRRRVNTDNPHQNFSSLKLKQGFRISYYRNRLSQNFTSFTEIIPEQKDISFSLSTPKRTQNWIIKKKAMKMKQMIYKQEMQKLKDQNECMSRIKDRLRIVSDLKKKKKNLILQYFST